MKPPNRFPSARKAREFLALRIEDQAHKLGVSLDAAERAMLRFAEAEATEAEVAAANDFDARYNNDVYEKKTVALIVAMRARYRAENADDYVAWHDAIAAIAGSDSHIRFLINLAPPERPRHDRIKLWSTALTIVAVAIGCKFLADRWLPKLREYPPQLAHPTVASVWIGVVCALLAYYAWDAYQRSR
jgi:hypothetical protein